MKKNKDITTLDEHLDIRYGKRGSEGRTEFEIKANAFLIEEVIKEEKRLTSFHKGQSPFLTKNTTQ